jgi:hypothetical protein
MFFQVWFWLLCALIVLPLPFKVYEYISGKDESPIIVKLEEMFNALYFSLGLIAFYGYLNNESYLFPEFWFGWLFISIIFSILSIFWSPKLKYASDIMGKNKMKSIAAIGFVLYLPLYFVVYQYASLI